MTTDKKWQWAWGPLAKAFTFAVLLICNIFNNLNLNKKKLWEQLPLITKSYAKEKNLIFEVTFKVCVTEWAQEEEEEEANEARLGVALIHV